MIHTGYNNKYSQIAYVAYKFCFVTSAIITTVLSVTRAIAIVCPFYAISTGAVWGSLMTVVAILLAFISYLSYIGDDDTEAKIIAGIFIFMTSLVGISGMVSFGTLRRKKIRPASTTSNEDRNVRQTKRIEESASVTIGIIVIVFCVTNNLSWIG